jgi:hypothetical protein
LEVQLALDVQAAADGTHAPPVQVEPPAQGAAALHPATHWPLAQTRFVPPQSLV